MKQRPAWGLWLLLILWFVINMTQSILAGLMDDETFFWLYGQHLAWGYYEHPPMVALLIKAGYTLFHNQTGVRLLFVLCSTISVFLMIRMSRTNDYLLFGALLFSTFIINAGGFLAAPDGPLLLFTALFFLVYQRYLEKNNIASALLLGVTMACLLYSKYNGILVILFTILSNFRLFRRKSFYLAITAGVILFLPHMIWLYVNDFPTIRYHLVERNIHEYSFLTYFAEYILGQIGIYGPLTAVFFFWLTFAYKAENPFDRALKFTAIGFLVFFLLYTFRGKIEPNWTLPALIPMMILTVRSLEKRRRLHPVFYALAALSLVLIIGFRIYTIHDYLHIPKRIVNLRDLHRKQEWADNIARKAAGRPVLFLNSYQRASRYIFYTGQPAFNMCDYDNHITQFSYWPDMIEDFQGKDVMVVDNNIWRYIPDKQLITHPFDDTLFCSYIHDFSSFPTIPVEITVDHLRFPAGKEVSIPVRILNPGTKTIRFDRNPDQKTFLVYSILENGERIAHAVRGAELTHLELPVTGYDTVVPMMTPDRPGRYELYVSLQTEWLPAGQNGARYWLEAY